MRKEIENYNPEDELEIKDRKIMIDALDNQDNVLSRKNTKNHFCVSAWIVDETFSKVLMVYHNIYNSWSWIGGHLDGENDAKKKILEEIEEETGVKGAKFLDEHIISLEVLEVKEHIKDGELVCAHEHFDIVYLLQASTSEVLRIKEDENKDVAWIKIEDINSKVREEKMLPLYRKLIAKAKRYEKGHQERA